MNPFFNGVRLRERESSIEAKCRLLFNEFASSGDVEWMSSLAIPLPLMVISELIGLPTQDIERLQRWSDAGESIVSGSASGQELGKIAMEVMAFQKYLYQHLSLAKSNDDNEPTLLSALVGMTKEEDGLNDDEAVSILMQLVIAGSESTSSLLGAAAYEVARNPTLSAQLRTKPELIDSFLEEVLRTSPPFIGHFRVATGDTRIGDIEISKGTRLLLNWSNGNLDPSRFTSAQELDLQRKGIRQHLSFGYGIHRCIGASLARMEAKIVISMLLREYDNIRYIGPEAPSYRPSVFTRRLNALRLQLFQAD